MTRRKGEITRGDLKSKWPRHVALAADRGCPCDYVGSTFGVPHVAAARLRAASVLEYRQSARHRPASVYRGLEADH